MSDLYKASMLYMIDDRDNVATALSDLQAGVVAVVGARTFALRLREDVPYGHKASLVDLICGEEVIKYGISIAVTKDRVAIGSHVHIQNCVSLSDKRTGEFASGTGAPDDMRYIPLMEV